MKLLTRSPDTRDASEEAVPKKDLAAQGFTVLVGSRNFEHGETPKLLSTRAVVQLASNETLLRRVVDAVACGDGDDYRAAIAELKLNEFCYLICH